MSDFFKLLPSADVETPDRVWQWARQLVDDLNKIIRSSNDQAWAAYTTAVTPNTGAITTLGAVAARYRRLGRKVEYEVTIPITTNGTGAGSVNFTLPAPSAAAPALASVGIGKDTTTNKALTSLVNPNSGSGVLQFYDGTYPGANGAVLVASGSYEV